MTKRGGAVIGENLFAVDNGVLRSVPYGMHGVAGWQAAGAGEYRFDETFKCRTCDFIDDCQWRMEQDQEILRRSKENRGKGQQRQKPSGETWIGTIF